MAFTRMFIQTMTHLSVLTTLSPWELCTYDLIKEHRPSSTYIFCQSADDCPVNEFYKKIQIPSQTIFQLNMQALPALKKTDLVFLVAHDDVIAWHNETTQKYRIGGDNSFKLVLIKTMAPNPEHDLQYIRTLFQAAWQSGLVNFIVLLKSDTATQIFTFIPFKSNKHCEDTSPVMLGECRTVVRSVFDVSKKVQNLNKCPITMSVMDDRPFIGTHLDGRLKDMFDAIASQMNFTAVPIQTKRRPGITESCEGEDYVGMRGDVMLGRTNMAAVTLIKKSCSRLEYLGLAFMQCYSWCTPVFTDNDYVFSFIFLQLQPAVWAVLFVTIFVVVISITKLSRLAQEQVSTKRNANLAFAVFAQVPVAKYRSCPVRFVVGIWLFAIVVIRTAYESEMKSQNARPLGSHVIFDLEELLVTNLRLCTNPVSFSFFNTSNVLMQRIFNKLEDCDNTYNNIVSAIRRKDRAIFTADVRCAALSSDMGLEKFLYSHTGGCLKISELYPIAILRGSPFKDEFKKIMRRWVQAGLLTKWLNVKPVRRNFMSVPRPYSINNLLPPLFVLAVGCFAGVLILLVEIVVFRGHVSNKTAIVRDFLSLVFSWITCLVPVQLNRK